MKFWDDLENALCAGQSRAFLLSWRLGAILAALPLLGLLAEAVGYLWSAVLTFQGITERETYLAAARFFKGIMAASFVCGLLGLLLLALLLWKRGQQSAKAALPPASVSEEPPSHDPPSAR